MARILLISNDTKLQDEFSQLFSGEHEFLMSSNLGRIDRKADAWYPDVVVVDRSYTILGAIILVKRFELCQEKKPAVLVVTDAEALMEKRLAMEILADDCLDKPFSKSSVQSRIHFWLNGVGQARPAALAEQIA